MMGAFAIVGFVVLPGLLALDLLAPGRHFPGDRNRLRLAAGGAAAWAVGLGICAALGLLLAPEAALPESGAVVLLAAAAGALLDRTCGEVLDARARRGGTAVVTPAGWVDDRVAVLARRSVGGGLVVFGLLHLPAAAGIVASLAFLARPARAVAAAVATPVRHEEAGGR